MSSPTTPTISAETARLLGVRRTATLRRVIKLTGLPPEILLDLAIELLDTASRKLALSPIKRQAVGLGAARWRNVSPEARSEALRQAARARWDKHKRKTEDKGGDRRK